MGAECARGKCCGDKGKPVGQHLAGGRALRSLSISDTSRTGPDGQRLDAAFSKGDRETMVALLSSQEPVRLEERLHPWAANPESVGALAAAQLMVLAHAAQASQPGLKEEIGRSGAVSKLVDLVRSDKEDRIQNAVLALYILTDECKANAAAAYGCGAMEPLMAQLRSPIPGLRFSTARVLMCICEENDRAREDFVRLGGIRGLVEQVAAPQDPSLDPADTQLEPVLNLLDLLESRDGGLVKDYALQAIKAGVIERLRSLQDCEDEEVRSNVEELLKGLQKFSGS